MPKSLCRLMPLVAFCILCTGCSQLGAMKPTAAVTGMSVQGVDAKGFTMNFDVDVKNPNSVAIPLTNADYKIGLAGTGIADGTVTPSGSIPANGSLNVMLPVKLTYENLLTAEQAIVKGGGDVPYNFDGGLSADTKTMLGTVRVPLSYSGTLHLKEILNNPQALLQSAAAQKLAKQLLGGIFGR